MNRRDVLNGGLALAATAALPASSATAAAITRVRPNTPGWPSSAEWARLGAAVGGRLSPVTLPDLALSGVGPMMGDPFFVSSEPGLTQSSGWRNAWQSSPSAFVVAAQSAQDVSAAVRFASAHRLRLVVKGAGHSYLGGSNAPDSLLVWTHPMGDVTVHDGFTPQGSTQPPVPAVSVGGGGIWLHAYQAVTSVAGRYVQGGGCTTVGVPGLVQGGGFGSFSKGFGTAAASLLEAEVVTADGAIHMVNHHQEPDLYWALKGGGGGTFGVITRLTLATHPLPESFGIANVTIHARSDEAFRRLLARFVDLYAANLCNPHWGEQAQATPDNRLVISMVFQGLTQAQAQTAWQPLTAFLHANAADYEGADSLTVAALPARLFWNADFLRRMAPTAVRFDGRAGGAPTDFYWAGDAGQVGAYWNAYTSAWLPVSLLRPAEQTRLIDAWFSASRHTGVAFHFNKGLAGADPAVIAASRDTATNPQALTAFALAIIAADGRATYNNVAAAEASQSRVNDAMTALRRAAPNAGAYVNECDYFQQDWQSAFWGEHYPRLLRIKRRYDPDGLFTVHHGVGSEGWSADGFTRAS